MSIHSKEIVYDVPVNRFHSITIKHRMRLKLEVRSSKLHIQLGTLVWHISFFFFFLNSGADLS